MNVRLRIDRGRIADRCGHSGRQIAEPPPRQVRVAATRAHQCVVRAAFGDGAALDEDQIGVADRAQAVGDDDARTACQQGAEGALDGRLGNITRPVIAGSATASGASWTSSGASSTSKTRTALAPARELPAAWKPMVRIGKSRKPR